MGSTFSKGSEQSGQSAGISTNQAGTSQALADSALRVLMPSMDQFATFIGGGPLPQAFTGNLSTQEQELASAKDAIMGTGSRGGATQYAIGESAVAAVDDARPITRPSIQYGTPDGPARHEHWPWRGDLSSE